MLPDGPRAAAVVAAAMAAPRAENDRQRRPAAGGAIFRRVVLPIALLRLGRRVGEENARVARVEVAVRRCCCTRLGDVDVDLRAGGVGGVRARRTARPTSPPGCVQSGGSLPARPGRFAFLKGLRDPRKTWSGRVWPPNPRPDLTVSVSVADAIWAPSGMKFSVSNLRIARRSHSGSLLLPRDQRARRRSWCSSKRAAADRRVCDLRAGLVQDDRGLCAAVSHGTAVTAQRPPQTSQQDIFAAAADRFEHGTSRDAALCTPRPQRGERRR